MIMAKHLHEYQQRVVDERAELGAKRDKLSAFCDTEKFWALDPAEQGRMLRQLTAMNDYAEVLDERIAAF